MAGSGLLFGAYIAMGIEHTFLSVIYEAIYENKDTTGLRILSHRKKTILRYLKTLFLLPSFGMKRPKELDDDDGRTLGIIVSPVEKTSHPKYRTTDRFVRELGALNIGFKLSQELAKCYTNVFYSEELKDGLIIYIDGHFKTVWSGKNIPKGKHGMMDKVMKGLEQMFINGSKGHPLMHRTMPGDSHLGKELHSLVNDFEDALGRESVRLVIVDNEGCSLDVLKKFDKLNRDRELKMYPVTMIRSNQYSSESDFKVRNDNGDNKGVKENDFNLLRIDKKGRMVSKVALTEFDYDGQGFLVRCALVKKIGNDKLTPIITLTPWDEVKSPAWLANIYYGRWPNQEAKFKEMIKHSNLNVNHGFKKIEVFNRTIFSRLEDTKKSLEYDKKRLNNANRNLDKTKVQIKKCKKKRMMDISEFDEEIVVLECKMRFCKDENRKEVLRRRLDRKNKKMQDMKFKCKKRLLRLSEKMYDLENKIEWLKKKVVDDREATTRYEEKIETQKLYEIDTEMDHIMANFKIIHENSMLYAREHFFDRYCETGLEMLNRVFFTHYGDIEIEKVGHDDSVMKFILNRFESRKQQKEARKVCEKFNEECIQTANGVKLEFAIKR